MFPATTVANLGVSKDSKRKMYMIPREKGSRSRNNVTNLAEVRQSRALAKAMVDEQVAKLTNEADDKQTDDRHGNRRFDAEKVARIKAAIAAGEYRIDANRVAEKFIEHDRNQ